MHRLIQDHLEQVLTDSAKNSPAAAHLAECSECREEISAMRQHASMLHAMRAPQNDETVAPRPGFYARVMERIEAQRPIDIWQLFFDSSFGRRVAVASMALAVLFSVYLVSSERFSEQSIPVIALSSDELSGDNQPGMTLTAAGLPDKDAVLVNLVTYREQ